MKKIYQLEFNEANDLYSSLKKSYAAFKDVIRAFSSSDLEKIPKYSDFKKCIEKHSLFCFESDIINLSVVERILK